MPSVEATSSSPPATSHRQNRRIPRGWVSTVEGSASSASQAATACRVSSSSTGARPRSVSWRVEYRTLWLYSSIACMAFTAARICRRQVPRAGSARGLVIREEALCPAHVAGYITRLRW
jgi:hypothetical protein